MQLRKGENGTKTTVLRTGGGDKLHRRIAVEVITHPIIVRVTGH